MPMIAHVGPCRGVGTWLTYHRIQVTVMGRFLAKCHPVLDQMRWVSWQNVLGAPIGFHGKISLSYYVQMSSILLLAIYASVQPENAPC